MSRLFMQQEGDWIRLLGPAVRQFTEYLKYKVKPDSLRRYDSTAGAWMVYHTTLRHVASMARFCYSEVDWSTLPLEWQMLAAGAEAAQVLRPAEGPTPHAVLFLTEDAPFEVVRVVYKVLAAKYHPDRGGSTERMAQLNEAYDQIRKLHEH